jgi:glycosyltransferase involved in cell wall biosynthesis
VNYLFLDSAREWSGTARAFTAAATGLAARGHGVVFAAEPDSTVERVVSELVARGSRAEMVVASVSLAGTWFGAARRLRTLARRHKIDVLLVHTNREHLIAAVAYRFGSHARVIRRVPAGRGLEMNRTGRVAAWLAPTCYIFADEADVHAAPIPRRSSGRVVARLGVALPSENDATERNAADVADGCLDIVCIHDASSRSRAAAAIRTIAMLAPRHPGVRLLIIGEGAYDDDLKMQAASLNALSLVEFLGDRDDQLQVMRGAPLGWVVADHDTAAYGILDFMSLSVPVLAAEKSVAEQLVLPDITGMLLPPDDTYTAAATVAELLVNGERRDAMCAAARARVAREFPESAMIDGFERAAAMALSRRRR